MNQRWGLIALMYVCTVHLPRHTWETSHPHAPSPMANIVTANPHTTKNPRQLLRIQNQYIWGSPFTVAEKIETYSNHTLEFPDSRTLGMRIGRIRQASRRRRSASGSWAFLAATRARARSAS